MTNKHYQLSEYVSPSIEPIELNTSSCILLSGGQSGSGPIGGGAGGGAGGFTDDEDSVSVLG